MAICSTAVDDRARSLAETCSRVSLVNV
ncbi:hypothetical protein M6B38_103035 [Iris pallida]|uniref:Uncharacterized protein n=1 Tax=Iris pallida TaxID=29817 RepID=A0AAX6G7C2_IRIPA|nr:hypothetical protein M6B38_103035 [Iris pallida]